MSETEHFITRIQRGARTFKTRGFVVETTDAGRVQELVRHVVNACAACGGPSTLVARRASASVVARCAWCFHEQEATMLHEEEPSFAGVAEDVDEYEVPKERLFVVDALKTLVRVDVVPEATPCATCGAATRFEEATRTRRAYLRCEKDSSHAKGEPRGRSAEVPVALGGGSMLSRMERALGDEEASEETTMPDAPATDVPITLADRTLRRAYELAGGFQKDPSRAEHKSVVLVNAYLDNQKEQVAGLAHFMRAVATDAIMMEQTTSTFVAFTHNQHVVGEAALQVCEVLVPPISTPEERRAIVDDVVERTTLMDEARGATLTREATEDVRALMVQMTGGLNLDQTSAAVVEMLHERGGVDLDYLSQAKRRKLESTGLVRIIEPLSGGFASLGGYAWLKQSLRRWLLLRLKHLGRAQRHGLGVPRGVILFGPGGTGKTLLVRALCAESRLLGLEMQEMKSKYVGESEAMQRRFFLIADSMAPCIVFKDEMDAMSNREAAQRESSGVERAMFGQLLIALGDVNRKWFFVGATNYPEVLDAALTRPGRVDAKIPMLWPDVEARREILRVHARRRACAEDVDLDALAAKTQWFVGAELEALVERAAQRAFEREVERLEAAEASDESLPEDYEGEAITQDDLLHVVDAFNLDPPIGGEASEVGSRRAEFARFFEYAQKHCNDKALWAPYAAWEARDKEEVGQGPAQVARPASRSTAATLRSAGSRRGK